MLPLLIACHRRTGPGRSGSYVYSYGLLAFPVSGLSPGRAYFCLAVRRGAAAGSGAAVKAHGPGGAAIPALAAVSKGAGGRPEGMYYKNTLGTVPDRRTPGGGPGEPPEGPPARVGEAGGNFAASARRGRGAAVIAVSRAFYMTAAAAMALFEGIAFAREPVSPHHIDDIIEDLLTGQRAEKSISRLS